MGETPVLIPNTEAKLHKADGTALAREWESRTLPGFFILNLQEGETDKNSTVVSQSKQKHRNIWGMDTSRKIFSSDEIFEVKGNSCCNP